MENKNKKISIYIVEDYMLTRATYKHYFTNQDDIIILGDFEYAEDCLRAMERQAADVILMDLGLPKMNGLEATKIIKENYPNSKVIILTSHEYEEEILASIGSGANAYALKDTDFLTLHSVIKMVDKGSMWIDPKIAQIALSVFPKPITTDFGNLYNQKVSNSNLTKREIEVLRLIVEGKSNTEIANEILISPNTAKSHVCNILQKLSVTDRVQAAVKAVTNNLL